MNRNRENQSELSDVFQKKFKELVSKTGGQRIAASVCNKSVRQIQRYLSGADVPFDVVHKLCDFTGTPISWITENYNGKSELLEGLKNYPELAGKEMVEALTTRVITPAMIEKATFLFLDYTEKNDIAMDNQSAAKAVAILCEMSWEKGSIDIGAVERLLKFRGLS